MPIEQARQNDIPEGDVVLYVGPGCHFVQYPLRGGRMFNQVAVFESPKAVAGEDDRGTPDELDAAFEGTCEQVQQGLPLKWRDKWWRMFDRDPDRTRRPGLGRRARGVQRRPARALSTRLTTGGVWGELAPRPHQAVAAQRDPAGS